MRQVLRAIFVLFTIIPLQFCRPEYDASLRCAWRFIRTGR